MIDIKAMRKKFGLTQMEFAELLGVSRDSVLRAENTGSLIPGMPAVLLLIDTFGQDAIEVLRRARTEV